MPRIVPPNKRIYSEIEQNILDCLNYTYSCCLVLIQSLSSKYVLTGIEFLLASINDTSQSDPKYQREYFKKIQRLQIVNRKFEEKIYIQLRSYPSILQRREGYIYIYYKDHQYHSTKKANIYQLLILLYLIDNHICGFASSLNPIKNKEQ